MYRVKKGTKNLNMITRAERRLRRENKIKQRIKITQANGYRGGTLFEKHVTKIEDNGGGYMAKHGTLLHYACGTNKVSQKVRDRNSWAGTMNWKANDIRKIDSMNSMEKRIYYAVNITVCNSMVE